MTVREVISKLIQWENLDDEVGVTIAIIDKQECLQRSAEDLPISCVTIGYKPTIHVRFMDGD